MADKTIDDALIFLTCGRFGRPSLSMKDLPGGILGTAHHNVAAVPSWLRPGIVCSADLQYGQAEFVYLLAECADTAMAAKQFAVPGSATVWYTFSNDYNLATADFTGGFGVIVLSAVTTAQYGWFQCGGPPAVELVSGLDGNFATDSTVAIGPISTVALTAAAIGLKATSAATDAIIGFAIAADAL